MLSQSCADVTQLSLPHVVLRYSTLCKKCDHLLSCDDMIHTSCEAPAIVVTVIVLGLNFFSAAFLAALCRPP